MFSLLSDGDGVVVTALIGAFVTLFGLAWRKAHVVSGEVTAVAQEARVAVTEARDNAVEARDNAVEARVAATAVQYQLQPNGGASLRDGLDEVRAAVKRLENGQADIGRLADRMSVTADRIDSRTLVLDQRIVAVDQRLVAVERKLSA